VEPSGPVQACNGIALPLIIKNHEVKNNSSEQNFSQETCGGVWMRVLHQSEATEIQTT